MSDVKFMGQEVKEVTKSSDTDVKVFQVSKSGQNSILDTKGVTKEVRDLCDKANAEIIEEGLQFCGERVVKEGVAQRIKIGAGARMMTVGMKVKSTNRNIKTGEEVVGYGQSSVSIKTTIPGSIKSGSLADIQAQIEKKHK